MSQVVHIPASFPFCVAREGECPMRQTCLRSLIWRQADEDTRQRDVLPMVNLQCTELQPLTEYCHMYRSTATTRYGRGMSQLFDSVPLGKQREIIDKVIGVFSSRSTFYLCKAGKLLTTPEQLTAIAAIFSDYGLAMPPCDDYDEQYDWS